MPKQDDETEGDEGFETGSELWHDEESPAPASAAPRSTVRLLLAVLLIAALVALVIYLIAR